MKHLKVIGLLIAALCWPWTAQAAVSDAVVILWVDSGVGSQSFGTGFFTSNDGRILTAYHVVQGARKVQVLHKGKGYTHVIVESISPEHDLATLRIAGLTEQTPFLRLVYELPAGQSKEELRIIGHAGGIKDQELSARMTRPGYVLSQEIRGSRLERLFSRDNVRLIPLEATIYNGISGGPVVSRDAVIGVLSGSLTEGGSIAWAIPCEYARPGQMHAVNKPVSSMEEWPELSLMSRTWKNLRKSVRVNEGLAGALDRYFSTVEDFAGISRKIPELSLVAYSRTMIFRAAVEELIRTGSKDTGSGEFLLKQFQEALGNYGRAWDQYAAAQVKISQELVELSSELGTLQKSIPRTQNNDKVFTEFNKSLKTVGQEVSEIKNGPIGKHALESLDMGKAMATASLEDAREYARMLKRTEDWTRKSGSPEMLIELNKCVRNFRKVGGIFEGLLTEGLEGWDARWRFSSRRGFRMVFPRGWEIYGGPDRQELSPLVTGLRGRGIELDMVFVNRLIDGMKPGDQISLMAATMRPKEITDDYVEQERMGFGLVARDVRVGREAIGGKQALVARGTFTDAGQDEQRYTVILSGQSYNLWLAFEMPAYLADSVIPQCRQIAASIRLGP